MPLGDRTGPAGMGPMTGRAAGYCAGYPVPGYMNPIPGRGFFGGGGWGRRNLFYATGLTGWQRAAAGYQPFTSGVNYGVPFQPTLTSEHELNALKGQAKYFEDSLEGIQKRIKELEKEIKKD